MGLRHASLFDAATAGALISQWLAEHSRVAPVKREAVLAAGSFDSRFRVAEDWRPRAAIEPQGILRALPPGSARHRPASSFYVADEITKLFRRAAPRVYGYYYFRIVACWGERIRSSVNRSAASRNC